MPDFLLEIGCEEIPARMLDAVVEDCVNAVGVDVNTASVPLLARVSGISEGLAAAVVARRDEAGPFRRRQDVGAHRPGRNPRHSRQLRRLRNLR